MTDDSKATPSVGRLSLAILDYCESHHTQDWRVSQVSSMIGDWLAARALHDETVNAHDALVAERDRLRQEIEDWRDRLATQCGQTLAAQYERDRLRQALIEAQLQLEYLHSRWPTGSSEQALARIRETLSDG